MGGKGTQGLGAEADACAQCRCWSCAHASSVGSEETGREEVLQPCSRWKAAPPVRQQDASSVAYADDSEVFLCSQPLKLGLQDSRISATHYFPPHETCRRRGCLCRPAVQRRSRGTRRCSRIPAVSASASSVRRDTRRLSLCRGSPFPHCDSGAVTTAPPFAGVNDGVVNHGASSPSRCAGTAPPRAPGSPST